MSHLTLFKASAGSGKTFTLTRRYLELLFQQKDNYKHILAATFTNKATEEMKERIISELYLLASGQESAHRAHLLSSINHLKNKEQLQEWAKYTLAAILHNYSHLSVTTIDRFFQKIIRSFAREMNVSSNYNIELDTDNVLNKAAEQLFYDLDKKGNEFLLDWVTRFAEEQIENGQSWNFTRNLTSLSKEFLKEEYKALSQNNEKQLGDFIVLSSFLNKIIKHQKILKQEMVDIAKVGVNICERYQLEAADFKNGKRSGMNFVFKTAAGEILDKTNSYHTKMLESIEGWTTKKAPRKDDITEAYNQGLSEAFQNLIQTWEDNFTLYNSIDVVRVNFYSLGILSDLEQQIKRYTDENNIFLLANSNDLIARIINDSDTPFIYEKTGSHYKHYMIDEFQDTSSLQWKNIQPLINNSLSEGHESLLVGDVKQSIYRWRNSDWKLLATGIKEKYQQQAIEEILPNNWRSSVNIIKFNNTLFASSAEFFKQEFLGKTEADAAYGELFDNAYMDIKQEIPQQAEKTGQVKLKFFSKEEKDEWEELSLNDIIKTIEELQDLGYQLSDMAILTRTNSQGAKISHHLLDYASKHRDNNYRYDIISNEALWISASYDVKFLVNTLRYLNSADPLIATEINLIHHNYIASNQSFITETKSTLEPDIAKKLEKLTSLSLLETCEELIHRFSLGQKADQAIFIQSFIDLINNFELNQNGGIDDFLEWWDENGASSSVSTPEEQDAITITTIHKSKGLEFNIIFIPKLGWDITDSKGLLWTKTYVDPLDELPYLPVKNTARLKQTVFKENYVQEMLLQYIDNLNLLYVAFTRAKVGIYAYGLKESKQTDGILAQILAKNSAKNELSINTADFWNDEENLFDFGEIKENIATKKKNKQQLWLKSYATNQQNQELRLRLQSHDFIIENTDLLPTASKTGKLWHRIFEQMNSINDLTEAINTLQSEGVIASEEVFSVKERIENALKNPLIKEWFSTEASIKSETTIITPEGYNYRPDRVVEIEGKLMVIDFKFGLLEKKSYHQQVKRYVQLIRAMGKQNVKAYLWYINLNKVVEVDNKTEQLSIDL